MDGKHALLADHVPALRVINKRYLQLLILILVIMLVSVMRAIIIERR